MWEKNIKQWIIILIKIRVGNQMRRFLTTKSYWQNFGTRHKFVANSKSWSRNLILRPPSRRSRWELSIGCRTRSRNLIFGLQNRRKLLLHLLNRFPTRIIIICLKNYFSKTRAKLHKRWRSRERGWWPHRMAQDKIYFILIKFEY